MSMAREQIQQLAQSINHWFHSIDLGQGVVTPGKKSQQQLMDELQALNLPDLSGKTVLDIGAWDGFFAYQAERLGAQRVVALDHYVWSVDIPTWKIYVQRCQKQGVVARAHDDVAEVWCPETLPGKRGFDAARQALSSQVEPVVGDFASMPLGNLGTFDVVHFLGVLYHLKDPMSVLRRLVQVTKTLAIIETQAILVPGYEDCALCEFYEKDELAADPTNWWAPNIKALESMCRAAGFQRVDVLTAPPSLEVDSNVASKPRYFRAVAHAWK